MRARIGIVCAAALAAAGCASLPQDAARADLEKAARQARDSEIARVEVRAEPYMGAAAVEYAPPEENAVAVKLDAAPMGDVIAEIARRAGYAIALAKDVDPGARVTVDIGRASPERAMREIAFAAGYVAVIDKAERRVFIARRATWVFQLPPRLLENLTLNYEVANDPAAQGSSGGGAASAAPFAAPATATGSGGPAAELARFSVSAAQRNPEQGVRQFFAALAGGDAEVHAMPATGLISVRGTGEQLRRAERLVREFIRDAAAQVEIEASLVEVSLTRETQAGIDWSRVIPLGGLGDGVRATVTLANAGAVAAPSLSAAVTTASISSVVKALERHAKVRVISRPRMLALNHSPAIVFDGERLPYLGSVTSTVTGTSPSTQTSGSVSYAMDGVSLAFKPSILDGNRVEVTVIPVLSSVTGFDSFDLGGGARLTAPRQPVRQAHLQVVAETGKTVIVGGTRSSRSSERRSGVPGTKDAPLIGALLNGVDDADTQKELVLMLRATIIPAPKYDPLVAEAL